ncbi:TetR/AcrR family transcriptional regulator [Aeromicrobium sp. UC242_57]|uniref:TetR/AcrR family transcriptional regulator n=1 Tax=Aeromicrobium sp. UC242_57 TaxID=3374624 RepID=UPI00378757C8
MAGQRHTDGRVARGQRTRDAIVEAHAALLREGVLKPTGKVVAERAGVSLRTLWLNYKDTETLLAATTAYWLEADAALRVDVDATLSLEARIEQYLDMRVRRLEHLAPAARSAALGEPFSVALQDSRRQHVERVQHDLEAVFAPGSRRPAICAPSSPQRCSSRRAGPPGRHCAMTSVSTWKPRGPRCVSLCCACCGADRHRDCGQHLR